MAPARAGRPHPHPAPTSAPSGAPRTRPGRAPELHGTTLLPAAPEPQLGAQQQHPGLHLLRPWKCCFVAQGRERSHGCCLPSHPGEDGAGSGRVIPRAQNGARCPMMVLDRTGARCAWRAVGAPGGGCAGRSRGRRSTGLPLSGTPRSPQVKASTSGRWSPWPANSPPLSSLCWGPCVSTPGWGLGEARASPLPGPRTHLPPLGLGVPPQQLDHVARLEGQHRLPGGSGVAVVILHSHHLGTCGGQGRTGWLGSCGPAAACPTADLGLPPGRGDRCLRATP